MRRILALPLVLAACLPSGSSMPAPANALACAEQVAAGLGYAIVYRDSEAGAGTFAAERVVPGEYSEWALGVITARLTRQSEDARLSVIGQRYRQRGGEMLPVPTGGTPGPATGVIGAPRRGRQRMSPGPVAEDARMILRQCSAGAEQFAPRVAGAR